MEDFANILHRDYGLKPGGKSAPMSGGGHSRAGSAGGAGLGVPRSGSGSRLASDNDVFSDVFNAPPVNGGGVRSSSSGALYDDVFGGPPTGVRSSNNDAFGDLLGGFSGSGSRPPSGQNTFTEDLLGGFGASKPRQSAAHASSASLDDIFSGGLGPPRSSSHNSFVNHDDDPFGSFGVGKTEPKVTQSQTLFDDDWNFGSSNAKPAARGGTLHASMDGDLLGGFSSSTVRSKQATPFRSPQSSPPRTQHSEPVFDEFLPGFGGVKAGKPKVVPEADAMRGIPIISTDDDDVFTSIPSSTSAATRDPFEDIPGAKSNGTSDPSGVVPSVASLDADEMRGIPPLSSSPILDDDPFSSGAELDPFANIIADSVPPPAESSYADPLDVFDLPPAASIPSAHGGADGPTGPFSNGSGSYDPFDGFPQASPVSTAKPKEDPPLNRSGSGSEAREGVSQGSGAWDEKSSSRRGFAGVPFTVDLNEVPEVSSPSYPSGSTFEERTDRESNGFASKLDDEPKFDEPSVAGVDDRRGKPDTDKVPVDIFEERWLTVDEVKLVTMPSSSRPPSRAPPRPGLERRRSSRSSVTPRDSVGERSRVRSDEYRSSSSRSNGPDLSQESDFSRERSAAREREAALVQKEREEAERERASRQRERAERQRERARERDRVREQEAARSVEASRERPDSRTDSSNGREDESSERARRAAERAAMEAQQRMEKAAAERAIAEARERAEKLALSRAAAAAREKEQKEREQKEREERDRREREERIRRERAKEERERERSRREKEDRERREKEERERRDKEERERERREREEREKERERDRERDRRRERERGAAEPPRATSASSRATSEPRQRPPTSQAAAAPPAGVDVRRPSATNPVYSSTGSSPAFSPAPRRPQASVKAVDDWTTLLTQTAPTGDEFQDLPGETPERRKLRLERHQKTIERAQQALKEKNDRDKAQLMEQAERSRAAGNLDAEIRRWATGKEGNLRALLSSLHLVLWPETNWKPLSLTDLIQGVSVKKAYQRAILCVHPDKVQQKGATVQQKYIAEKVFDLLKEAFAKFNSSELY